MWADPREVKELTARELEVLQSFASGCSTAEEVAEKLVISQRTVKNHLGSAYKKLGVPNIAGALLYSLKEGIIDLE
jgi:NarL family two-component system response regulator LiaR